MSKSIVYSLVLVFVLMGVFGLAFRVQRVEASGTIYIRANGLVEGTDNITNANNVSYTFTDDINDSIIVERSNIIIDGAGYTLQGLGFGNGFYWSGINNVTIKNTNIKNFGTGIYLYSSSHNTISGNNITANNGYGIRLDSFSNSSISGNKITNNRYGVWLDSSSNSRFYHNNLIDNTYQVYFESDYANVWDDGYSSGGNYWSDYTGVDLDHDGIGDTEHVINENNTDNYPLMGMFSDFKATSEHHVQTICNSTISGFQFNGTAITFDVSGENDNAGFCRICIPKALMNETYRVLVNGTEILPAPLPLPCSNNTHTYLYFTYNHSTQEVIIIPEFPSLIILPLFMIATLLAVIVINKKMVWKGINS